MSRFPRSGRDVTARCWEVRCTQVADGDTWFPSQQTASVSRTPDFGATQVIYAPNGTNPGLFQIRFQNILALLRQNVLNSDLKKSRICLILGQFYSHRAQILHHCSACHVQQLTPAITNLQITNWLPVSSRHVISSRKTHHNLNIEHLFYYIPVAWWTGFMFAFHFNR